MNNKGFTLIEIIVCIVIISVISVGSFVGIKTIQNNKIENTTEIILKAASVYAETEKDKNGLTISNAVSNYAKGVQIPLTALVNKGYLEQKYVTEIESEYKEKIKPNESFYVLLAEQKDYCDSGAKYTASWTMGENEEIYLCDKKTGNINSTNIISIPVKLNASLEKYAVSNKIAIPDDKKEKITNNENGIYAYYNEQTKKTYYYYRGAVNNNYVVYGKDKNGNDLYWRILWYNNESKMKLVLDEVIPLKLKNIYGKYIQIDEGDEIYQIPNSRASGEIYLSSYCFKSTDPNFEEAEYSSKDNIYTFTINKDEIFDCENFKLDIVNIYDEKEPYFIALNEWYDSTNLDEQPNIIKNNTFCDGTVDKKGQFTYYSTNYFECINGLAEDYGDWEYVEPNNNTSVGFLQYGDVIRAGFADINKQPNDSITSMNDNYLINGTDKNLILSSLYSHTYSPIETSSTFYFINNKQIYQKQIYFEPEYSVKGGKVIIKDEEGNDITNDINKDDYPLVIDCDRGYYIRTFEGNSLKPVIILDMNNYKLSENTGTKEDYFRIEENKK